MFLLLTKELLFCCKNLSILLVKSLVGIGPVVLEKEKSLDRCICICDISLLSPIEKKAGLFRWANLDRPNDSLNDYEILPKKKALHFILTYMNLHLEYFVPSLIVIGTVVLKKGTRMWIKHGRTKGNVRSKSYLSCNPPWCAKWKRPLSWGSLTVWCQIWS